MKLFKSRFQIQLIVSCILLGTVPSLIIGSFSYFKSSELIQRQVNESNAWALSQAKISIETQLTSADAELLQLYNNPSVLQAGDVAITGNNYHFFNNISACITNMPNGGADITNTVVVNLREKWVVTDTGIYDMDSYQTQDPALKIYSGVTGSSQWFDSLQLQKVTSVRENGITLVRKSQLQNNPFLAYLSISYDSLRGMISNNSKAGAITVLSGNGCVLVNADSNVCGADWSKRDIYKKLTANSQKSGSFNILEKGTRYSISYIRSTYNGWIYLTSFSVGYVTRDSQVIGLFTASVCLVLVLLICLVSLLMSKRIYLPVNRIYETINGHGDMDESKIPKGSREDNELTQIEQNLGTLMRTQTKMKTQLWKQADQLSEFFTVRLMLESLDPAYIDEKVKLFGYPTNPPMMTVFVTRFDTVDDEEFTLSDTDLLLYAINNIIGELVGDKGVILPVIYNQTQITVMAAQTDFKSTAFEDARKIQDTIFQALHLQVSIGISSLVSQYGNLHKAYRESMEALQNSTMFGTSSIVFIDDIWQSKRMKPIYPAEYEKEILDACRSCDRIKAREMMQQFLDSLFTIEANRHESRTFIQRLLLNLIILQKETCGDHVDDYLQQFYNLRSRKQIEIWLKDTVLENVITQVENVEGNRYSKICQEVIDIIHENYNTKLTLEDCSARLGYHPSYVRRILKKEMGVNFSEYLSLYRINVAKKWLIITDMKLSEIADRLKYENTENFIRWFKKAVGMTPGQFRETQETRSTGSHDS
jgi:two-component system, response regulator YesN